MQAGQCDAGKVQVRKALQHQGQETNWGPEHVDRAVQAYAGMYCRGRMTARDAVVKGLMALNKGAHITTKDAAFCRKNIALVARWIDKVKPTGPDDFQIKNARHSLYSSGARCLGRAGDCAAAFATYKKWYPPEHASKLEGLDAKTREQAYRGGFEALVPMCKGKP